MADEDLAKWQQQAAQQAAATYNPIYEEDFRRRQMARFAEEIPYAEEMMKAARSGEMQAREKLSLGQLGSEMATATAGGANPLAARASMFGAAQQGLAIGAQGAQAGQQQLEQARQARIESELRQVGYGQQLSQEEQRRRMMMQQAQQAYVQAQAQEAAAERARNTAIAQGALQAAAAVGQGAIKGQGQR